MLLLLLLLYRRAQRHHVACRASLMLLMLLCRRASLTPQLHRRALCHHVGLLMLYYAVLPIHLHWTASSNRMTDPAVRWIMMVIF